MEEVNVQYGLCVSFLKPPHSENISPKIYLFNSVCLCAVQVCGYMCMYVCVHACGSQRTTSGVFPQAWSTQLFEIESFSGLDLAK